MTQSEINKMMNVAAGNEIEFDFDKPVVVTVKPKYMRAYDITCTGIKCREMETGKSMVNVITTNAMMNWSCLDAQARKRIQEKILKDE